MRCICDGALVYTTTPCANCLSWRPTNDVLAMAREWQGFPGTDWNWGVAALDRGQNIPLYRPAGRDLGARVLAALLGIPAVQGVMLTQRSANTWELRGSVAPGGQYPGGTPAMDAYTRRLTSSLTDGEKRMSQRRGMERLWVVVPALATIPNVAPELRAARAMVLALMATEPGAAP